MRCLNCRKDGISLSTEVCPGCGVYLPSLTRDLLAPGSLLDGGKYRIDYALGQGGFGITYRAVDLNLERLVAIKEFYPQDYVHREGTTGRLTVPISDTEAYQKWLQRFEREGRILARLNHAGIVKVHALFKERDTAYLVMELLAGKTLGDELDSQPGKQLPVERVIEVMSALVQALDTVHREGVYHLDLKPDNVMLTAEGRIVLVDFGAARQDLSAKSRSKKSTTAYTPEYAPLELLGGEEVGPESDLFELGMILHEMLTGTRPPAVLNRLHQELWEPPTLSDPWRGMLTQALRLQRVDRPQHVKTWWQTYITWAREQERREAESRDADRRQAEERARQAEDRQSREAAARAKAEAEQRQREQAAQQQQEARARAAAEQRQREQAQQQQQAAQARAAAEQRRREQEQQQREADARARARVEQQQAEQRRREEEARRQAEPNKQDHQNTQPPRLNRRVVILGGLGSLGAGGAWLLSRLVSPPPQPVARPLPSAPFSATLPTFDFEVVTVNDQGQISNRKNKQAKYFTEDLGKGVTLEMVAIPAGEFVMGSPADELDRSSDEGPQHRVTVPAFYMGRFQVTQAQWQAVMGSNRSNFKGENRPVERVSWNDAQDFCQRLSQKTGRSYRLPSEAEWEYACRAGTTTPFHFGPTITPELANYNGTYSYGSGPKGKYRQTTTEVGSFPANVFGLCDMHGNVWEWCEDVWHESYQGAPTDGSAWVSGGSSTDRLLRGGSWDFNAWDCRSAVRYGFNPGPWDTFFGFRVVASA